MVILRTRNKITDYLMILAWASPFNIVICMNDNLIVKYPISAKNDDQDMPPDAMLLDNCGV